MIEFKYDTQLLIKGTNLDEDAISDYFTQNFKGDCLLAVGDDELIKIHFHTNEPWEVLKYCASLGEYSTSLSRIWTDNHAALKDNYICAHFKWRPCGRHCFYSKFI